MRYLAMLAAGLFAVSCQPASEPTTDSGNSSDKKEEGPIIHVDVQKASTLLTGESPPTIIDVRTQDEYDEGHLKGAKVIDFLADDFEENLKKLDREKSYLVHCAVGGRSTDCLDTWKKLGFTMVYHLDGGIQAWEKAKLPVER